MHRSSMNKVILVGRIGNDPEKRATQTGTTVSNFSIATNETYRDQSGQTIENTEWHRCVAFGKTADFINSYVKKGRLVYVDGRLRTRKWQDNNNTTHYSTEINVDTCMMLDKRDDTGGGNISYDAKPTSQQQSGYQNQPQAQTQNQAQPQSTNPVEDTSSNDDELPF